MKKLVRILLIIAVWATVTWIFREKLLPVPKPDPSPPPHFRAEPGSGAAEPTPSAVTAPAPPEAPADPVAKTETLFPNYPGDAADDLQRVKGIGPVYQHRLADIGITSFDELIAADPAHVAERIDANESQVAEWIDQARQLDD